MTLLSSVLIVLFLLASLHIWRLQCFSLVKFTRKVTTTQLFASNGAIEEYSLNERPQVSPKVNGWAGAADKRPARKTKRMIDLARLARSPGQTLDEVLKLSRISLEEVTLI
jgi:hypothetical protein